MAAASNTDLRSASPLAIGLVEVWRWHIRRSRVAVALAAATLGLAGLAFAVTVIAAGAAWATRETFRTPLADLGRPR